MFHNDLFLNDICFQINFWVCFGKMCMLLNKNIADYWMSFDISWTNSKCAQDVNITTIFNTMNIAKYHTINQNVFNLSIAYSSFLHNN
jgi:hypothetical protein